MEIQVGKTYEVREPQKVRELGMQSQVKIVRQSVSGLFVGNDYCYYSINGFCHACIGKYDLVKEV